MATVNKDFKVKNGLVVEGENASVNGFDVLTKATDDQNYIISLIGGSATSENTGDSVVLRDANGDFAGGTITAETSFSGDLTGNVIGNVTGTVSDISNHDTDDLSEGTTNKYFTDQRALDATSSAYDASGSAATAESNANTYTDNLIGDATVDGTGGNTVTDRIATAVSNLVDSSPEALDTLNELAAALGDDPNFATTVSNDIGTKVSKSGDTMTGELVLSGDPTDVLGAAPKQYVDSAESSANSFTTNAINNLDTDDISEGSSLYFTDARAVSALEAVIPNFTEVDVNSVATQVAATVTVPTAGLANAHQFARADYDSAEYIVKVDDGTDTEVSKVLLTLNSSNNVSITEYGIVGTNGTLGTVSATADATTVTLQVTTNNNNSSVSVSGTLIK